MAGRLVAVWVIIFAVLVLVGCAVARLEGALSLTTLALAAGSSVAASFLAGRGRLRGKSLGARDNGTGIVAALIAAEASYDPRLGILITGAEEFGLVGARVFARDTPDIDRAESINLDTLDDEGKLYLVSHDAGGERFARDLAPSLAHLHIPIRSRRLPLGIFVDSAPLARKKARAITIGRLTWKTLQRIHTPADTPDDLSFTTAQQVARALALN
ncbi:MAG TPA: M28 family peptidase [Gemmatimonadales bacterium]|nr:M28 family peptidase [Gemmatimonadales bacterium]